MAYSKKTKPELIAEVKKLQRKIELLSKKSPSKKQAISKADKPWTSLFKHSANTVAIIDKKLIIIDININSRKTVIGKKAYFSVSGESKTLVKKSIENVFKTAKTQEYIVSSKAVPGKPVYVSCKATPIKEKGKVVYVVVEATDITKEVEAKKFLKQNEEKFKKLSDAAFEGIVIHQAGKVAVVNKALSTIFNYSETELIGQPIFKFIHEDFHEFAIEKLKNKDENPYEMVMLRKGNKPFWAKLMAREIIHEGAQARVVAIRDISLNKEAEKKIKESEERFKILSNATFEGIVFSENGKIIDANDQFLKMYGYKSLQELLEKNVITDFIVPTQQNEAKQLIRLPISKLFEVQTYRKDGSILSVVSRGQNIPYFGRTIRATVVYDVSERKQYEERIKESERTLSVLMNNLPGMAYRCLNDENWTMQFISNGCIELTGYSPKTFINNNKKAFADIIHPQDRSIGIEHIKHALKNKTPFEIEYRIITKKGEVKWVWEKGEGIFSEDGNLLFLEGFITDINEKKENELEINRSRENYKYLVDNSPDAAIIHIDRTIKFANTNALKLMGVDSFEELEKASILEYVLPEYHKLILNNPENNGDQELDFAEIKIKNKKGEIKEVESKSILIKFNGINAIQVIFKDITTQKQLLKEQLRLQIAEETNKKLQREIIERKNAEAELKRSEENYRDLFENSTDFIQSIGIDGKIIYVNNAWKKGLKYTDADLVNKNIFDFIHPESLNHCMQIFQKIINGESMNNVEITFITKDGQPVICEGNVSCKNENENIISTRGVFRDITARKEAEGKLKVQSSKLNAVFESSSHLIWTVDRNMQLTSFNKNFSAYILSQYKCEAKAGLSVIAEPILSTTEYNNFWKAKYESAFKGERHYFEIEQKDPNGTSVWHEYFLNPIFDENGMIREISGIGNDVSEKKLTEEKIRQSLEEKDILLKEVHHRVKNNLQVISSILNLQSSYVKDPQTLNILRESQNRIKSMAFIHESLYQTKDLSSINFSEYVTSLAQNLIHSYSNFNQKIKLTLDIQLIFLNLDLAIPCGLIINEIISNSLKYAFVDNPPSAEVIIKMQTENDNITLIIGDNGIGLPQDINYKNTESLGLQLVVTLTEQISGTIEIDTKKGTVYNIVFKQNQIKNRI